jgi:hypothetical protein
MGWNQRRSQRTTFSQEQAVRITAPDASWQLPCIMLDISATGAKLLMKAPFDHVDLKEFVLLLTANGLARRRCELIRADGQEIGVRFIMKVSPEKRA